MGSGKKTNSPISRNTLSACVQDGKNSISLLEQAVLVLGQLEGRRISEIRVHRLNRFDSTVHSTIFGGYLLLGYTGFSLAGSVVMFS